MTKKSLIILLLLVTMGVSAQIKVEVSETVELMGILSRMAGFQEYCHDMGGQYTKDTEAWFAPYKTHPIINYYQELRAKYGISHDAVMTMAIHIAIDGGKLKFLADEEGHLVRWKGIDVDSFVVRLNQFYSDTRFHDFFQQRSEIKMKQANALDQVRSRKCSPLPGTMSINRRARPTRKVLTMLQHSSTSSITPLSIPCLTTITTLHC